MEWAAYPGGDLVEAGLRDLVAGVESVEALLVSIGAPRLTRAGLAVPRPIPDPEHRLYGLLEASGAPSAHSRYNALLRRLVSFEHALECAHPSTPTG
jgi:hypothetical protein